MVGKSPGSSVFIIIRPDGGTGVSQSSSHRGEVCLVPQTSNKHVLLIIFRTVNPRLLSRLYLLQCSERSRDWCDLFGLGGAGMRGPLSCTEVLVDLLPHYFNREADLRNWAAVPGQQTLKCTCNQPGNNMHMHCSSFLFPPLMQKVTLAPVSFWVKK